MENYKAKTLIDGFKLGYQFGGKKLIAVPDKFQGKQLRILFGNDSMILESVGSCSLTFRKFDDKFGRNKDYTLFYYEWNPDSKQTNLGI